MKNDKPWFAGMRIIPLKKVSYKCSCPACRVPFVVPEELPERQEDYYGIDVFIIYCPICGQKLRFSIDDTPTVA
jgi:RNase P subunit RPR2